VKNQTIVFRFLIILFLAIQNQFSFAVENYDNVKTSFIKKKLVTHKIDIVKKKYKRKKLKRINRLFKKFKNKFKEINKPLIFVIASIVGIIIGLAFLGTSAWIIPAVILAILIYIAFATVVFMQYIENGFKLEWYWWAVLFFLLGVGIFMLLYFLGATALSYMIIQLLAYVVIAVVAVVLFLILIISFFKALFSSFKSLWIF